MHDSATSHDLRRQNSSASHFADFFLLSYYELPMASTRFWSVSHRLLMVRDKFFLLSVTLLVTPLAPVAR